MCEVMNFEMPACYCVSFLLGDEWADSSDSELLRKDARALRF
jgi:hypothetical protein